jgi:hypothetical protein
MGVNTSAIGAEQAQAAFARGGSFHDSSIVRRSE